MTYYGICAKCDYTVETNGSQAMLKMALFDHVMRSRRCRVKSPTEINKMIFEAESLEAANDQWMRRVY